jgi:hypothetical protein
MHTKKIEDLFDITRSWQYVSALEKYFFDIAGHLSSDYNGGYWKSKKLAKSWYFLLDEDKQFVVDGIAITSKTFSYVVNYIVLVNMINILHDKGLEQDPLYMELRHIWMNLMDSIEKVLSEEERYNYYKLID